MKFDGIIFDLDGTLWDSTTEVAKTWSYVISKYNLNRKEITVEDLKPCMGKLLNEIAEILLPNLDEEMQMKIMNECYKYENEYLAKHGATLYDNLEETLKVLVKDYKLFIVSNCQDGYIESFFKSHGLNKYFIDYECPGRTALPKAENIKLIVSIDCSDQSDRIEKIVREIGWSHGDLLIKRYTERQGLKNHILHLTIYLLN